MQMVDILFSVCVRQATDTQMYICMYVCMTVCVIVSFEWPAEHRAAYY